MKKRINPTVECVNENINNDGINDMILKIAIEPTCFVKKGRGKIIREKDIKTPREILMLMREDTTELADKEIIKLAKRILKSGDDMKKASYNEANITYCKQVISSLPKNSYTYYSCIRNELIPYLSNDGIRDRAITIALKELVEEGFLEEVEFYHYYKKVKGYKVIKAQEF